ncbi:hypothetical protein M231_05085 [Tremella mesenterica]|uniref:C2H2-type domain-containing protein n=1 Tax=Tremella mesenterica TaxID=5217 RepID=A0A4Q1BJ05_TREME|nr:hypothetical protein M231_05085 [Tremella mesenterica]
MPSRRPSAVTVNGEDSPLASSRARGRENGKEKETFGCPFPGCNQFYSRLEYLKRHQRKHQDVRPFLCADCRKAFARSDVLLRHRRRCHPTPPPPDQISKSPPPPARAYPGVPVSASRDDAHNRSPTRTKRVRPASSSSSTERAQRRRLSDDDEDDEDDEGAYPGENSAYQPHGLDDGDIYGLNNGYYPQNSETINYAPQLPIPIFQQQSGYHNLEDASALLSMAYPGGLPAADTSAVVAGQRVVPDWNEGQTLHMMMEHTNKATDVQRKDSSGTASDHSGQNDTLPESMGNFLGTMNWLSSGASGHRQCGAEGDTPPNHPSPRPTSPFPLSSLFSPSAFGLSLLEGAAQPSTESDEDNNQTVMSILESLSKYEVPQTRVNPNPERPILRIDNASYRNRMGEEPLNRSGKFYLPADRFAGCYQIPHWALPPLRVLSLMANRTFHTVLNHLSFVHTPTFKLIDTAACLAFAMCTVGGIRTGAQRKNYTINGQRVNPQTYYEQLISGPVTPNQSWEQIYTDNYISGGRDQTDEDLKKVEEWYNAPIVRNEKTNMLVKSFSLAQGVLMTEYNVALLQALILYNAPFFLSEDESERTLANMGLGTIVNISRQVGFFNTELEHFNTTIELPQEPTTANDLDLYWRRWVQLETRRRTAFLVYLLDTISALESSLQCILSPSELCLLPLPATDALWRAETAEQWLAAAKEARVMTLDEAMRRLFFLPTYGSFEEMHEKADTKGLNLLCEFELGPFARVAMIISLLRGVIDIGEGKRDRGDWRDLTDLWVNCSWLKPGTKMLSQTGADIGPVSRESLRGRFGMALQRWREGWDFDSLCPAPTPFTPSGGASTSTSESPPGLDPSSRSSSSSSDTNRFGKLNYCEEALPFYWLAQALLSVLNTSPPRESGWNAFSQISYSDMLKSSRTFTRMGEGVASGTFTPGANLSSGMLTMYT